MEARKVGVLNRFEPGDGVTPVGVRSSLPPPIYSDCPRVGDDKADTARKGTVSCRAVILALGLGQIGKAPDSESGNVQVRTLEAQPASAVHV